MELKLKDYEGNLWGKVFQLESEQFGVHTFLVSKFPAKEYETRHMFIGLDTEWAETYFYSSVMNDKILQVWDSINDWRKSYYKTTNGGSRFDRQRSKVE